MSGSKLIYCRFCAEQKPIYQVLDLTQINSVRNDIIEKLTFFAINWLDLSVKHLPGTVCNSCYHSLTTAHEFFTKIKTSQDVLANLLTDNLKQDDDSNPIYGGSNKCVKEEFICEDSMNYTLQISNENMFDDSVFAQTNLSDTKDTSWNSYPWFCKDCNTTFDSIITLREHTKEVHEKCNNFQCADCDTPSNNFKEFAEHAIQHRENLGDYCQYCNMKLEPNTDHISHHSTQPHCQTCGETFQTKTSLQKHINKYQSLKHMKKKRKEQSKIATLPKSVSHEVKDMKIESWSDYPGTCLYCGVKVSDVTSLRCHLKEVHMKCFGIKCCDCDQILDDFTIFFNHVWEHRPNLKLYCQYCNHKFNEDNIIHVAQHINQQCDICGESFESSIDLEKHKAIYGPPKQKRVPFRRRERPITEHDLTCGICQKLTKSLSCLRAHKKLHTDRYRDFFCDRCGKSFFTKGALTTHNLIHDNPDPQICRICKKSFLTLTRLKKHVNTHYDRKPFECAECHKCFRLKDQLKGHMITHTNLFPYSCQYCNKMFKFKTVLKNHEVTHTGARPYVCGDCNMDFSCWSNCNKHMKRKHGTTLAKGRYTANGYGNAKIAKFKKMDGDIKEWTEQIMVPRKRGKKVNTDVGS